MRRSTVLFIFLVFTYVLGQAQKEIDFTDQAVYSVITCAPGDEAYSAYGHTALRVVDPILKLDVVFNYGIFSFASDNFIFKFVKGETDYQLGVYPYKNFIVEYVNDERSVWEQVLNLDVEEKKQLEKRILNDYKPENRVYRYNFFYDNCATRVRDRILESVNDSLVTDMQGRRQQSFRDLIEPYIHPYGWMQFGINLAVAKPADDMASFQEEMFLPEYLMANLEQYVVHTDSTEKALLNERTVLNQGSNSKTKHGLPPAFIFAMLLIVSAALYFFLPLSQRWLLGLAYFYYFVVGVAGLLLSFLSFVSVHPAMFPNYNLLWALPFHVLAVILSLFKSAFPKLKYYWYVCVPYYILISLVLLLTGQFIDNSILIINAILFVSAIYIVRRWPKVKR